MKIFKRVKATYLLGSSQSLAQPKFENISSGSQQVRRLSQHGELDGRVGVDFGVGSFSRFFSQKFGLENSLSLQHAVQSRTTILLKMSSGKYLKNKINFL